MLHAAVPEYITQSPVHKQHTHLSKPDPFRFSLRNPPNARALLELGAKPWVTPDPKMVT